MDRNVSVRCDLVVVQRRRTDSLPRLIEMLASALWEQNGFNNSYITVSKFNAYIVIKLCMPLSVVIAHKLSCVKQIGGIYI